MDRRQDNAKMLSFLHGIGLESLVSVFLEQEIELRMIPTLTHRDLIDIGVNKFGQRWKIISEAENLKVG